MPLSRLVMSPNREVGQQCVLNRKALHRGSTSLNATTVGDETKAPAARSQRQPSAAPPIPAQSWKQTSGFACRKRLSKGTNLCHNFEIANDHRGNRPVFATEHARISSERACPSAEHKRMLTIISSSLSMTSSSSPKAASLSLQSSCSRALSSSSGEITTGAEVIVWKGLGPKP